MKKRIFAVACAGLCWVAVHAQDPLPYQNPSLSPSERAEDLLHRLTLREKVSLMKNGSAAVERLGIPAYDWWNEALHGVGRAGLATVFPQTIGMAATFDDESVYETFNIISTEARAKHHQSKRTQDKLQRYQGLTFWTPNINIFRDPRWGRGQETYGEDPYLTGRMGVAVVLGLQGDTAAHYNKLHACAKHFAVHSGPEWNRHSFDAENIAPRDLWETYLPAFKELVQEARVKEVMCAYNRYEGEPCCSSKKLLIHILREQWGYRDIVVSDCSAISDLFKKGHHETHATKEEASADAVISGTDLECGSNYSSLVKAVRDGLITEAQIDTSVCRLLKARFELGLFDPDSIVPWAQIPYSVVDCEAHKAKALEMARKSMTLLYNKDGILPLDKGKRIAVIGPNATDSVMQWGNYNGFPSHTSTLLLALQEKGIPFTYRKGCNWVGEKVFNSVFDHCSADGKTGFSATYWNNTEMKGDAVIRTHVPLPFNFDIGGADGFASGVSLYDFTGRYTAVFSPEHSGDYIFTLSANDGFRLIIDGDTLANFWYDSQARANNEICFTAEAGKQYDVVVEYVQGGGEGHLRFDVGRYETVDPEALARSIEEETVIFSGGITPRLEGEEMRVDYPGFRGGDRTAIELPQVQSDIITALKKAGKRVILVLNSGSAIGLEREMPYVDAVLQAWYPGQAGGIAVADVLFGDYNPAGRLPITFYKNTAQLPDFEDYSMKGRTYRYMQEEPLFPFGHGLSYTTFAYGKASLDKKARAGKENRLTILLTNSGTRDGEEVIQVYVRNLQDPDGPEKSLRAFKRVSLRAGETRKITVDLRPLTFDFYDPENGTVWSKPGKYEILYGGTSDDKELKKLSVTLK